MSTTIAVLASGRGSNFQAIINAVKKGECDAEIKVLITDNPEAKAIARAEKENILFRVVEKSKFPERETFDNEIKKILDRFSIDLVVLAGYMRVLKSGELLETYKNRIINIHPSLLPSFPGVAAQRQAFEYGVRISGVTVHFVDQSLDGGPIIHQEAVDISDCSSPSEVSEKILEAEHRVYPMVVDSFSKGRYIVEKRRVRYIRTS